MNKIIILTQLLLILNCGCISEQGRFAICDFDFRKAPQIAANVREAEAPYRKWNHQIQDEKGVENIEMKTHQITWWETVLNAITKLECRVTLIRVEWQNHDSK
jgi:hypothetical protein